MLSFEPLWHLAGGAKVCFSLFRVNPDPPILAFFDFLAFFVFRFSLLFCAFFLPFPRILGVPRREKPLAFLGKNPCFFQKSKDWGVFRVKLINISLRVCSWASFPQTTGRLRGGQCQGAAGPRIIHDKTGGAFQRPLTLILPQKHCDTNGRRIVIQIALTLQSLLFCKKQGFFPRKARGFSLRGTPKILGKGRKNAQKSKENRKTKTARKSKKARIGGSGWCKNYFLPRGEHTCAKVSRWKWEVYRDTSQKYRGHAGVGLMLLMICLPFF